MTARPAGQHMTKWPIAQSPDSPIARLQLPDCQIARLPDCEIAKFSFDPLQDSHVAHLF
jgi:hypothetical protein